MIKPLSNYIVLKEKTAQEVLGLDSSKIIITEQANFDRPNIATVVVCGPDVTQVKVGDEILFKYHLFEECTLEKVKYLIGKDDGVIGIM